jgi:hypothetical protein
MPEQADPLTLARHRTALRGNINLVKAGTPE